MFELGNRSNSKQIFNIFLKEQSVFSLIPDAAITWNLIRLPFTPLYLVRIELSTTAHLTLSNDRLIAYVW
jgi:hypothetical protein